MPSWVQDPNTGKLIPKDEYVPKGASRHEIMVDIEPFVSPVDGSFISSRSQLREHNKRHGVTNIRDYGDGYFERKAHERNEVLQGKTPQSRKERIEALREAIAKHEG
jgi:hypothetical protein